eukprot:CAMPEP_0172514972 /NCGR_PEP_ID=MMETSP1066-20121228/264299_1 /TAXON_ID=671091 /ORGANISM="Coscinodiscus wailesii, Strain CCMP2513" /LENGTH=570 /DNA_ID=CAMNT_0013295857 /DNA_START=73 /DNA_END=1785 /DNA_ORIENTATION=-
MSAIVPLLSATPNDDVSDSESVNDESSSPSSPSISVTAMAKTGASCDAKKEELLYADLNIETNRKRERDDDDFEKDCDDDCEGNQEKEEECLDKKAKIDNTKSTDMQSDAHSPIIVPSISNGASLQSIEQRREQAASYSQDAMPQLTPCSSKKTKRDRWQEKYEELVEFKAQTGHCRVPNRYQENIRLGQWVVAQRQWYKKLQGKEVTEAAKVKIEMLDELGFTWTVGSGRLKNSGWVKWQEFFDKLVEFKSRKGHCYVPSCFPEDPTFGKWVARQRQQYNKLKEGKPSQITEERISMLESIGFQWTAMSGPVNGELWKERLEQLKEFHRDTGHFRVKETDDPILNRWVYRQKHQYKQLQEGHHSNLTKDRIEELESIGFNWELNACTSDPNYSRKPKVVRISKDDRWNNRYQELVEFKNREGHTKVPWRYFDNLSLSEWTSKQRQHWKWLQQGKKSPLTPERVEALKAIDFTFEIDQTLQRGQSWYDRYDELEQFYHRYGHCSVPRDYDNKRLANWVSSQRKQYSAWTRGGKTSMTQERIETLNEIGFVWSATALPLTDNTWNEKYEQL